MSTLTAEGVNQSIAASATGVPWAVNPTLKAIGQRLLIFAAFMILVAVKDTPNWPQIGAVLLATSLFPQYRKQILCVAALAWIYFFRPFTWEPLAEAAVRHDAGAWLKLWPLAVAAVWGFTTAYLLVVRCFPKSWIGQHAIATMIVASFALFGLAAWAPLRGGPWFFLAASAAAFATYLWYFAFWVTESKTRSGKRILLQTGYIRPFFGTMMHTPIGKGSAYLDRVEAKTDEQLAACQRKGLQLMLWSFTVGVVWIVYQRVIFGSNAGILHHFFATSGVALVPSYADALAHQLNGTPYPWHVRWLVLICRFSSSVLHILVAGHQIIATCRMAGFDALPNTDRPFSATSIADFYNRISYYYKELLATFFFFPTFLRYFKGFPRLRVFTATLAAAGFGNFIYHQLERTDDIFELGLWNALVAYRVYAVYCLVLGTAIGISQMRLMKRRGPMQAHRRFIASVIVVFFYTLINALDDPERGRTVTECLRYVGSLFWL